jgi:single-stranded-DNA-specific exonuclease
VGDVVDVAFVPQINEYRGLRSVQLNVMDIRPGATCRREVLDQRELYQRFAESGAFSPDDAARLLPVRSEFVAIWRYLIANSQDNRIQEEFTCMARKIVRATGMPLTMGRTRICLDVFAEQGLIRLHHYAKYDEIEITTDGRKVDLDSSPIIRSLRRRRGEKE